MSLRKVVVTGMGAVSPYGEGVSVLMENLYADRSAVVSMKEAWKGLVDNLDCWLGAPMPQPLDVKSIPRQNLKTMGKTAIMSYFAAKEALQQADISQPYFSSGRMGVSFSSTTGSADSMESFFRECFTNSTENKMSSGIFFKIMSHTTAANLACGFNICGRVISPCSSCSSAAQSIGLGFECIQNGLQDIMVCGGADELHFVVNISFDLVQATSFRYNENPTESPRPFDKDRDGTVCGEGAGCLVLESEESALSRGATILGEVIGFSTLSNGVHIAHPQTQSIVQCLNNALDLAGKQPDEIDYVNAHGTGTIAGDIAEAQAICQVFGEQAVAVSSLKGHFGHTLGASGALELIACLKMMENNTLIPTHNFQQPGEGCEGIAHVQKQTKSVINTFIKNSFAFGGINTVLVLKRYKDEK